MAEFEWLGSPVSAFDMSYAAPDTFESAAGGYSGEVVFQFVNGTDAWRANSFAEAGNRCIVDLNSDRAGARRHGHLSRSSVGGRAGRRTDDEPGVHRGPDAV